MQLDKRNWGWKLVWCKSCGEKEASHSFGFRGRHQCSDYRIPTVMENPGKKTFLESLLKISWKVMENLLKTERHEIFLKAEKKFF